MDDLQEVRDLIARLFAESTLPKSDAVVTRALTDDVFRREVDRRLHECGFVLLDNPYSAFIGVGVERNVAKAVFHKEDRWLSNTLGLNKDDVTLLVILWALLIIPKRMRQQGVDQDATGKPFAFAIARQQRMPEVVGIKMLLEDFDGRWKKNYLLTRLSVLARHEFIVRDGEKVREGPRLDLFLDYKVMQARIIDGVLGDYAQLVEKNRRALEIVEMGDAPSAREAGEGDV